jgi:protein gp37
VDGTKISWTDATWNPVTGCTKITPGCDNCYAFDFAERKRGGAAFPNGFDIQLREHKMFDPLKWREPRRVFVNSMSDVFHEDISDDYIARMFATMALAPRHQFQVLTKRPGRMRRLLNADSFRVAVINHAVEVAAARKLVEPSMPWPLPNVWLGVTIESGEYVNRIEVLRKTPAVIRFISAEPLIGPLDLAGKLDGIHWVIDGGESGNIRRPAEVDWFRAIRDACLDAGVAYLHKQGNARFSGGDKVLDGREWHQYPTGTHDGDDVLVSRGRESA